MVPPWPWKIVMIDCGDVVDLVGVERPEQRAEAADQRVEVERGLGALQRDGRACGQPLVVVAALELHVAIADQVQVADRRRRALEQLEITLDGEVDLRRTRPPSCSSTLVTLPTSTPTHGRTGRRADRWHC